MKKLLATFQIILLFSSPSWALTKKEIENLIVADLAKSLGAFKTPEDAIKNIQSRLKPKDVAYLKEFVSKKLWVELPVITQKENLLEFRFSNDVKVSLEVSDYWKGEFKLNGYKLETKRYKHLEEKFSYLRRAVARELPSAKIQGAGLFSLLIPSAQASFTCNQFVRADCMEVSVATSLWLAETLALEDPIHRCSDLYYFNRNQSTSLLCLAKYKDSFAMKTIYDLSEVLAETPDISIEIECNKGELPDLWINGTDVAKIGSEKDSSAYTMLQSQDPNSKLKKLPELAIHCCRNRADDPVAGKCEDFVNNHLGSSEKRKTEFGKRDLNLRGKSLKGIK